MKFVLNFLIASSFVTLVFTKVASSQVDEQPECWVYEDTQRCPAKSTDPEQRQVEDNSGSPNAGSGLQYVTATGQGNSINGCSFCTTGGVNDPQSPYGLFVPGQTEAGESKTGTTGKRK